MRRKLWPERPAVDWIYIPLFCGSSLSWIGIIHTSAVLGLPFPWPGWMWAWRLQLDNWKSAAGWSVQDAKPLCEPNSGFVGIKSPSDSEKVPLMCRAKYRLAGTLVLWLEWRKNTESILTQKGHLPFSQSAWCFDVCSCRLFFPNTPISEH